MASERNDRFDPPSSTVQVGIIEGGTAPNIVPKTCKFQWQVRSLPDADADFAPKRLKAFAEERLLPRMKRVADTASIETQHLGGVPAFLAEPGSEAVALALALTGANSASAVSYATEAGLFEEAGCSTVICGPGDIEQAHAADEFVTVAQLDACMAFSQSSQSGSALRPIHPDSSCPALCRASTNFSSTAGKTWMAGTSPAMTKNAGGA